MDGGAYRATTVRKRQRESQIGEGPTCFFLLISLNLSLKRREKRKITKMSFSHLPGVWYR